MPAVIWMAGLTILLTAALGLAALNHLTGSDRRYYLLMVAGLPSSFLINRLVKIPLISGIGSLAGIPLKLGPDMPLWFLGVIWLAAPIFEEAIKILPMALRPARKLMTGEAQALWAGLALGIGFGLGEAAYLAYGMVRDPATNSLPWYMFSGFVTDRLIVSFGHGLMTAVAVMGLKHGGGRAFLGYLAAVGLHALLNLGPILSALKLISPTLASFGTYAAILLAFLIVMRKGRLARKDGAVTAGQINYFSRE